MAAKSQSAVQTFSLHWGSGVIEEEAQFATPYHRPTIQLLKFTEGEPKRERGKWTRAGSGVAAATTFAGNIMVLVVAAMLFDDGEATGEPSGAAAPSDGGDLNDPEN